MISLPEALFWSALVALPYVVLRVRRAWVLYGLRKRREALKSEAAEAHAAGFRHQWRRRAGDVRDATHAIERANQASLLRWTP